MTDQMNNKPKPLVLCIMDGWGNGDGGEYDAIMQASTPNWDRYKSMYPVTTLRTDGSHVGLPDGQMGNSEVGHMNIGAGRVVKQLLPRINDAFADGSIMESEALQQLISTLKANGGTCHLMGLLSDGGVHAHGDHIKALRGILEGEGISVALHAFTDGRDTPPKMAAEYIKAFEPATVTGRYYAMDRDKRWERVQKAYDVILKGTGAAEGGTYKNASAYVEAAYSADTTDEFVLPAAREGYDGIKDGDAILFANFRADRARELLTAFLDKDFDGFARTPVEFSLAAGMVEYSDELAPMMSALFPPQRYKNILGEVLSDRGYTQLRTAETEKYPHVTFFFNGGEETPFEGEERILVPSPKVATYDLQPEMSAPELTDKCVEAIKGDKFDVVIINFANPDMVGHTGVLDAVKTAVETVDTSIGRLHDAILAKGGALLLTADHGNADKLWDEGTSGPHTAHTLNPVPFVVCGAGGITLKSGKLADIAPTMLKLLGEEQPEEMTGGSLIT